MLFSLKFCYYPLKPLKISVNSLLQDPWFFDVWFRFDHIETEYILELFACVILRRWRSRSYELSILTMFLSVQEMKDSC